jgi:hypothetical protein
MRDSFCYNTFYCFKTDKCKSDKNADTELLIES